MGFDGSVTTVECANVPKLVRTNSAFILVAMIPIQSRSVVEGFVMLRQGKPVPEGCVSHKAAMRILAEIANDVAFPLRVVAANPAQAVVQT